MWPSAQRTPATASPASAHRRSWSTARSSPAPRTVIGIWLMERACRGGGDHATGPGTTTAGPRGFDPGRAIRARVAVAAGRPVQGSNPRADRPRRLRTASGAARFDDVMSTTWQSTTRFVDAPCGATNPYALVGDMQVQEPKLRHAHPAFITHNR